MNENQKIKDVDFLVVTRVQLKIQRLHKKLGSWRLVQEHLGLSNPSYAFEFVAGVIPASPDIRKRLGLPKRLPSERPRSLRRVVRSVGLLGWEDDYKHRR